MPTSAPTRCLITGCGAWATNRGRCPEHYTPWEQPSANTRALTGRDRARIRDAQLRREPNCRVCGTRAAEADHITPIALGGARFDPDNLQSLCRPHHNDKTKRDRALIRATRTAARDTWTHP